MPNLRGWEALILIAMLAAIAFGMWHIWRTRLPKNAGTQIAEKGGKPVADRAPVAKLWVGGILLAYGLFSLGVAQAAPFVIVVGIVVLGLGFQDRRQWNAEHTRPAITAGWHDDPESPERLRYHDGTGWTERTADKSA